MRDGMAMQELVERERGGGRRRPVDGSDRSGLGWGVESRDEERSELELLRRTVVQLRTQLDQEQEALRCCRQRHQELTMGDADGAPDSPPGGYLVLAEPSRLRASAGFLAAPAKTGPRRAIPGVARSNAHGLQGAISTAGDGPP